MGFGRVAVTAYLLGTHSRADSLAVAISPIDTLNSVLINSMVFAFVPMLTERRGAERGALFLKLNRLFTRFFTVLALAVVVFAPWLIRVLAPGLDPAASSRASGVLRIVAISTIAAGIAAIHSALLYTDRRFAPSAFYQASLNTFTILGALLLFPWIGVYGFAIGYTLGAWAQLAVVYWSARSHVERGPVQECHLNWRHILTKPGAILMYATLLALNITFTRAYATHVGPGMAAALDYCMRGVGVPMAFLVSPLSNALLPEIARLRNQAWRLIDQFLGMAALAAVIACGVALTFRTPAIHLIFQRGSFTAESTALVSAVFLGLGPSLIGWSLLELTARSLFALDRPLLPVIAAAIPLTFNIVLTLGLHSFRPELIGVGAAAGLFLGFLFLLVASRNRAAIVSEGRQTGDDS